MALTNLDILVAVCCESFILQMNCANVPILHCSDDPYNPITFSRHQNGLMLAHDSLELKPKTIFLYDMFIQV